MAAEILEFGKPDEWYIARAESWSRRGELAKSLLYAYMTKGDTREVKMCRARMLYESGNLSLALAILSDLRADGDKGADMYALTVKTLDDMTRYISAAYFIGEGAETGAFPFLTDAAAPATRREYEAAIKLIRGEFPDNKFDSDISSVLYVAERMQSGADESLAGEMLFDEHDFAGSEIMFRATGILYPEKLVAPLAYKLIDACKSALDGDSDGQPRHEVLSTLAVALAAVGRKNEARETAEMLAELDLPDGDLELVKTVAALLSLDMGDEARFFLDELCAVSPTPAVLCVAAEAELNEDDKEEARDRIARCLMIAPDDPLAKYLMRRANDSRRVHVPYSTRLPSAEAKRRLMRVFTHSAGESDPFPEKTAEAVRYLLSCGMTPATFDAIAAAVPAGVARGVFTAYLTDIEGLPVLKREILLERLLAGGKNVPLYSFGERMVSPSEECIKLCGGDEALRRAYCRALATAAVYCDVSCPVNAVFSQTADVFASAAHGENFEKDCAAAIMLLCRADVQCAGLDAGALHAGANKDEAARLAASAESRVVYDFGEEDK
ncbi:MAG TPA: hypothetical protein H9692_06525 [Firmicutes bacterium]|nr:hypothetical protein [Bacillota bacterium]